MGILSIDGHDFQTYTVPKRTYPLNSDPDFGGSAVGRYSEDGFFPVDRAMYMANCGFRIRWYNYMLDSDVDTVIVSFDLKGTHDGLGYAPLFADLIEVGGYSGAIYNRNLIVAPNWINHVADVGSGKIGFYTNRTNWNIDTAWTPIDGVVLGTLPSVYQGSLPAGTMPDDQWYHYGFKFSPTGVTVWRDGVEVGNFPIAIPPIRRFVFMNNQFAGNGWTMDNLVIQSGSGGYYNDFLGPTRVATSFALTDHQAQWSQYVQTPFYHPGSSNARLVGQILYYIPEGWPDDDRAYVYSFGAGEEDIYTFTYLRSIGTVYAVALSLDAKCTNTGETGSIQGVALSPTGTKYYTPTLTVPDSISYPLRWRRLRHVWELNPETGLPWAEDDLSFWKFGMRNVSAIPLRVTQVQVERLSAVGGGSFAIYRARQGS